MSNQIVLLMLCSHCPLTVRPPPSDLTNMVTRHTLSNMVTRNLRDNGLTLFINRFFFPNYLWLNMFQTIQRANPFNFFISKIDQYWPVAVTSHFNEVLQVRTDKKDFHSVVNDLFKLYACHLLSSNIRDIKKSSMNNKTKSSQVKDETDPFLKIKKLIKMLLNMSVLTHGRFVILRVMREWIVNLILTTFAPNFISPEEITCGWIKIGSSKNLVKSEVPLNPTWKSVVSNNNHSVTKAMKLSSYTTITDEQSKCFMQVYQDTCSVEYHSRKRGLW